nr:apolipoprotein(a)-like isoform X4 [Misgurnus anguillicaudatus]
MEVQTAILLFCLFLFSAAEDCMNCTGEDYRGSISITESGYTCQRWDSQTPHSHLYIPARLHEKDLEENYCRNPDGKPKPWCFTTNPSKRWEFCSVPQCLTELPAFVSRHTCTTGDGSSYRGIISVTESGKTCQSWESQTPHVHSMTSENFPCKGLRGNYCRNPDGNKGPWCYTSDPETRWEYCNVSRCEDRHRPDDPRMNPEQEGELFIKRAAEDCMLCNGEDYRGNISITENGFTCQRWDSKTPHNHFYNPALLFEKDLEENYCRNPNGLPKPWCFTTNPSKRWEFCSVPQCLTEPPAFVSRHTCTIGDGSFYRGNISVTESGKTCQSWETQTPHVHSMTSENFPCKGLRGNYCRNPDGNKGPWCYTSDPETRWEYCNVSRCEDRHRPDDPRMNPEQEGELFIKRAAEDCMLCNGEDYRGNISITENGFTCQRWDSKTPNNHKYIPEFLFEKDLEENYCRNPNGLPKPWCFTTNPSKRWEFCSVPQCLTEPPAFVSRHTCTIGDGSFYRGNISVTESGKTCQSWETQTPHVHSMTSENFPCKGLRGNYCRNPDGNKGPWCYTSDPETRWEYCNVSRCEDRHRPDDPRMNPEQEGELFIKRAAEDCMLCNGEDYRGNISITENGFTCQRWDSKTPHNHFYNPALLFEKDLEENYCRNPNGLPKPWCFTTNPSKRWEFCSVPRCLTEPPVFVSRHTCTIGDGSFYRGNISVTESGKTCQSWETQTPHVHSMTSENFPCKGLRGNYCRNPDGSKGPWCFTSDPERRWEYCSVSRYDPPMYPEQEGEVIIKKDKNECIHCRGQDYRGKISTSESGYTCQRWDSQTPVNHSYDPSAYPGKHLEENYCRNPDDKPRPWCWITNSTLRWEFCSIPQCTTEPPANVQKLACATDDGISYRGNISVTVSGKTCQKWTSETPHKHSVTPTTYPCSGLEENYCRNPDSKKGPWCYTKDPETRWEYCSVPICKDPSRPAADECMQCTGEDYRGTISVTESGYTCQRWDSQRPHKHKFITSVLHEEALEENYCRNPDGKRRPWCYTTDPSKRWEFCSIPECATEPTIVQKEFKCATGKGRSYRGKISVTVSGKTCQKWLSNIARLHSTLPEDFPCGGLEGNYCRNPNNRKGPWCFTTDPRTQWEYCDVPNCEDPPRLAVNECLHCIGEDYRGNISITESGHTCQRWDSQTPHKHLYVPPLSDDMHLEENYCRNPDRKPRPWCYTTDPSKSWEFCSIPKCLGTKPPTIEPTFTCATGDGSSYRGSISVTKSEKTCQRWTSNISKISSTLPEDYPCSGLQRNYCRNPDGKKMPWCYTTDPKIEWEYCDVPVCEDKTEECTNCKGIEYRGKISTTENEYTCQRWDSQKPHKHGFNPAYYFEQNLVENYCRNPSRDSRPWCYTTDPDKRWEYCSIPQCTNKPPTVVQEHTCASGDGSSYRGMNSHTKSWKTCRDWSFMSHRIYSKFSEDYPCNGITSNYCRNPDRSLGPWCYTGHDSDDWEFCDVPSCEE